MTEAPIDAVDAGSDDDDADRKVVEHERAELREFITGLSPDDIKSGGWFTKLVAHALSSYTDKVTWQYFQERYEGACGRWRKTVCRRHSIRWNAFRQYLRPRAMNRCGCATARGQGRRFPASRHRQPGDGDIAFVLTMLGSLEGVFGAPEIVQRAVAIGTRSVSYDVVAANRVVEFAQNQWKSTGIDLKMAEQFYRDGASVFDVLDG